MKTLIVEDDFSSRLMLQELLKNMGPSHVAVNGKEALDAVREAFKTKEPYDLICLDIMMPKMDGQQALKEIRGLEEEHGREAGQGAKVIMTTALSDKNSIMEAFRQQCDGYLVKPIDKAKLLDYLTQFDLMGPKDGNQ